MLTRNNQRGEGKLGCIMGLLFLAFAVFVAYKVIPVKVKATEFRDAVYDNARSAGNVSQGAIRKSIAIKGQQLGLPIQEKDVKIQRRSDYIIVEVEYTVPVEFPGFVYQWHFHEKAENPVF